MPNPDHMTLKLTWNEVAFLRGILKEYRTDVTETGFAAPIADGITQKMNEFTLDNIDPFEEV